MKERHAVRRWFFEAVVYGDADEEAAVRCRATARTELYARRKVFERLRSRGLWIGSIEKHPRRGGKVL